MSSPAGLDELIAQLEQAIGKLSEGSAPLEELVGSYERANRLLREADERLEALRQRLHELAP